MLLKMLFVSNKCFLDTQKFAIIIINQMLLNRINSTIKPPLNMILYKKTCKLKIKKKVI